METRGNDSREKEYLMKKLVLAACVVAAAVSFAESTPVMLSLFTPVQIPSSEYDVTGFRLSLLYGDCKNFKGLDITTRMQNVSGVTGSVSQRAQDMEMKCRYLSVGAALRIDLK